MVEWSFGFRDPTFKGWVILLLYLVGTFACARASRVAQQEHRRDERWFWIGFACLFALLGLNKQLDFQTLLTELARIWAKNLGLFEWRRQVQGVFLALLVAGAGTMFSLLVWRLRHADNAVRAALVGAVLIFAFIAARAAYFNHARMFIGESFDPRTIGRFRVEFAGIAVVSLAAFWYRVRLRANPVGRRGADVEIS